MEIIFEEVLIIIIQNMDVVRGLTIIVFGLYMFSLWLRCLTYNEVEDRFGDDWLIIYIAIWVIVYAFLEVVAKAYNG